MSNTIKEENTQPVNLAFVDPKWKGNMFYHTNIRNVGLYTSVSLALLGYATRLKQKTSHTTALFFLVASFFTNFFVNIPGGGKPLFFLKDSSRLDLFK